MELLTVEENSAIAAERCESSCPPNCHSKAAAAAAAPWLVFSHGEGGKDQTFFNIFESNNNNIHRKSIPEMGFNSLTYYQSPSHQGWLIVHCCEENDNVDDEISTSNWKFGDCFLWNPVTLEIIQLPCLLDWVHKYNQYHVSHSVLSSPPSNNLHDHQSLVFVLFQKEEDDNDNDNDKDDYATSPAYFLLFCRPGVDRKWRKQELSSLDTGSIRSLICFKGKLHVLFYNNFHLEIEPQLGSEESGAEVALTIRSLEVNTEPFSTVVGMMTPFRAAYVESHDEIFKVVKIFHPKTIDEQVYRLEVYKLNLSIMAWEKVESLGDHVLFIGGNETKASCSAADLGLTRGCVYFTLPEDKSLYQYDFEGQSISVSLPCPDLPTPWLASDWVTMPTTVIRDSDGRRRIQDTVVKDEEKYINVEVEEEEEVKERQKNTTGGVLEESGCCKASRSTTLMVKRRTSFIDVISTTTFQSPWLLFPIKEEEETIYNLVDPNHNNEEKYHMNLSEFLSGAVIRFSKGGWLLMSRGHKTLFFFNPFTRAMIQLPDLPDECYLFPCIAFSSLPTSSDCSVFAIYIGGPESVIIFSIKRGDNSWSYLLFDNTRLPSNEKCMEFMPWFNSPVFFNGAFYCLDYEGMLGVFDSKDGLSWKVLVNPDRPCDSAYQKFLVDCEGELLSVFIGHLGKWVQIFRLDFSNMEWVKVESLGKHALFISHTSCFSAIAPNSSMENKIYFPRLHGEGILFYSLDTGRYHSLGSHHSALDFYNTKEQLDCTWIEPNWSQNTDQELDWLSSS